MLKVFFGHHKCASQWSTLIIERLCNELGWKLVIAYQETIDKHGSLAQLIKDESPEFLIIPESRQSRVSEINIPFKGFHIIRDPRDIIVSCYFSHKTTHKVKQQIPTAEHKQKLNELPFEEGMDYEISVSKVFIENLYSWDFSDDRIFETKFDEVTKDPKISFANILVFLEVIKPGKGHPSIGLIAFYNRVMRRVRLHTLCIKMKYSTRSRLQRILKELNFGNLQKGPRKSLGDTTDHYRTGRSGDFRNHLTKEQEDRLLSYFPGILQKMNFEE